MRAASLSEPSSRLGKGLAAPIACGLSLRDHLIVLRPGTARRVFVSSVGTAALIGLTLWPAAASGGHSSRARVAVSPLAGSLDRSFGDRGAVTRSLGSGEDPYIGAIAVQPDGRIVVAGGSPPGDHGLLLARYLRDGSLDPSFGHGGYVETPFRSWAFAHAIALQSDGKIVVAGASYQGDDHVLSEFTLARYNSDGSLDTSFGTDGITNTVIPEQPQPQACYAASESSANALSVLPSGEILAAGWSQWNDGCDGHSPTYSWFALARYTPSGSLDPTFGDAGITQTSSHAAIGVGLAVQPDGEVVASEGNALDGYTANGSLNIAFDRAPKLQFDDALTLQKGDVVVAGLSPAKHNIAPSLAVARYKPNGRLDPRFGTHGEVEIKRIKGLLPSAILAQSDGKLLITATGPDATPLGPADLVRLRPNGRLDTSFGRGGIVSFSHQVWYALALQTDGKILLGGTSGGVIPGGKTGGKSTLSRVVGGDNCVVPTVRRETISKAQSKLKASYCTPGRISRRFSNRVARGRVITTAPPPGDRRPEHTKVKLLVSRGKPTHRS
jgi:uncharacterized delta-60 repeat protein